MLLLVGIGNYGSNFDLTRHNVGFMIIDALLQKLDISCALYSKKFNSHVWQLALNGVEEKIMLMKPQTYVNLSGDAVAKWKQFYKQPNSNIFVFYDDITMKLGKLKASLGGRSGGHNGIKSINSSIGKDYYKIKVGIGLPSGQEDLSDFVLGRFTDEELQLINKTIDHIISHLDLLISTRYRSISKFLNISQPTS